jgi:cytochrome c5
VPPASSAAAASDDLVIDEDPPRAASPSAATGTGTMAATVPTVLQPRVLIYDGVCHLCHRGECEGEENHFVGS